jgi:hypothetical protein
MLWVTSRGVCQGEGGGEALVAVFVHEHGEQDALHRSAVLEGARAIGKPVADSMPPAAAHSTRGPDADMHRTCKPRDTEHYGGTGDHRPDDDDRFRGSRHEDHKGGEEG